MIDVGDTLGRKIGPLPVWAWGGVVGGGILIVRAMSGGGASSPFVQPIAQDGSMNFEPGGAAGGGDAAPPWYATIPGVGTIIDRPPGEVTIIKPPATPTTPAPVTRTILTLKSRTNFFTNPLKPHTSEGASGSYIVQKVTIGGKQWYKIVGTVSGAKSTRIGQYIPFYSNPTTYAVRQGDTTYAEGDSTPVTPIAIVPAAPPMPLPGTGIVVPPTFYDTDMGYRAKGDHGRKGEPVRIYRGPDIDDFTPIASSARVTMPSFTGKAGSVNVPAVPYPSARAGRFDPSRFADGIRRAATRRRVPPTTVAPAVLSRLQERITARRSLTG